MRHLAQTRIPRRRRVATIRRRRRTPSHYLAYARRREAILRQWYAGEIRVETFIALNERALILEGL